MYPLIPPDNNPTWSLIVAMIAASPRWPWVWAGLVLLGVVLTRRQQA